MVESFAATSSRSQRGVEVAPQTPTLSSGPNHSGSISSGDEIWYVLGFLDRQRSHRTFPFELEAPDTNMITSCERAKEASSSCLEATWEQIVL